MKTIEYKATYQSQSGHAWDTKIIVSARDINSGFRRAVSRALKGLPIRHEIVSVEFVQVL
jgi:hypothetical protein